MILLAGIIEDQAQRDLRGGARRRVLVNVNLAIDASSARVLVHDLSTTGLRMQTETALSIGDVVSIEECAPISKDKTWTVVSAQTK